MVHDRPLGDDISLYMNKETLQLTATKWNGNNISEIFDLCDSPYAAIDRADNVLKVKTWQGTLEVKPNHYVVRDVQGGIMTSEPEAFESNYRKV